MRYPKYPIMNNYRGTNYLNQCKDLKLFHKEDVNEKSLSPIVTYDRMKTFYPIQRIDLRFRIDDITPGKFRLLKILIKIQLILICILY